MSRLMDNRPPNAYTSNPDRGINENPNISSSAFNMPPSHHDSNSYILEPRNLSKQNEDLMSDGRQQHHGLHHPQHAGMQNAPPSRDENIMQRREMGGFDRKFEHPEQRAMKIEDGVSGSSRNDEYDDRLQSSHHSQRSTLSASAHSRSSPHGSQSQSYTEPSSSRMPDNSSRMPDNSSRMPDNSNINTNPSSNQNRDAVKEEVPAEQHDNSASAVPTSNSGGSASNSGGNSTPDKWETLWRQMYNELLHYKSEHSDCNVPKRYTANPQLGAWVATQRKQYRLLRQKKPSHLSPKRVQDLESVGFIWIIRDHPDEAWSRRFAELLSYRERVGDCLVPQKYAENPQLGAWVCTQRHQHRLLMEGRPSSLTDEQIGKLEGVGFSWCPRDDTDSSWNKRLEQLRRFREDNGHTSVPVRYHANPKLGRWVKIQREQYALLKQQKPSSLSRERFDALQMMGFQWEDPDEDDRDSVWFARFRELQYFRMEFGHCNVPPHYGRNPKLSAWVEAQRKQYRMKSTGRVSRLTQDQIGEMESLGFAWTVKDDGVTPECVPSSGKGGPAGPHHGRHGMHHMHPGQGGPPGGGYYMSHPGYHPGHAPPQHRPHGMPGMPMRGPGGQFMEGDHMRGPGPPPIGDPSHPYHRGYPPNPGMDSRGDRGPGAYPQHHTPMGSSGGGMPHPGPQGNPYYNSPSVPLSSSQNEPTEGSGNARRDNPNPGGGDFPSESNQGANPHPPGHPPSEGYYHGSGPPNPPHHSPPGMDPNYPPMQHPPHPQDGYWGGGPPGYNPSPPEKPGPHNPWYGHQGYGPPPGRHADHEERQGGNKRQRLPPGGGNGGNPGPSVKVEVPEPSSNTSNHGGYQGQGGPQGYNPPNSEYRPPSGGDGGMDGYGPPNPRQPWGSMPEQHPHPEHSPHGGSPQGGGGGGGPPHMEGMPPQGNMPQGMYPHP
eukprot:CAMPEP_0194446020 /NCGR_PEP_ID=MMETSP0176-20130528/128189_1 /TAXON_ID=216777 /ORGANISM="Proboscia alata, Strain PI-D3" /LENGTH=935 /DNA_ID=CAMNT_0039272661 /DNA_START=817 /DNA_END=3621 /DNA_ORIENTATION=-